MENEPNRIPVDTVLQDGDRLTVTPKRVKGEYCAPKLSDVKKFLKSKGFALDRAGPGDHETWKHSDGAKVQLNAAHEKKYADKASIRAIAEKLGWTFGQVDQAIRNI